MKMKLYLASAIMALSWMGCSQEEVVNETKGNAHTICAIIEGTSRSTVTDAGKFSWADGDQISVHDGTNNDIYTYSGSGNEFTYSGTKNVNEPVVAYYPAHESHTTLTFYLPASYGDENTEYVADTHAAMIATPPTNGDTYAFMHLGGVMRFNVKNVPAGANQFTFYSLTKRITGSFDVTKSNGVKTIETEDAQENCVSIKFKPLAAKQDMTFYVPLPLGSYKDYRIEIAGISDGNTFTFGDTTNNLTEGANTIDRKSLLLMPTFTCTLDANGTNQLVKGESAVNVIKLQDSSETTISDDAEVIVTPGDADAVATLNYTPANDESSTLSISDGSAQGTPSGESEGKVVVNTTEESTIASCEINAPSLTVELSTENNVNVTYAEVTALTAQQTLIIGSGVTVETLKLKGGNVIIGEGATVNTIQNAEGYTEKTYIIGKGTLTNSPSDNNIIIVSNESELALRLAAENGGDVTLTDDIVLNEPIVIASGKTVTLDLNEKTISQEKECTASYSMITNKGKLTITGSGTISFDDLGAGPTGVSWGTYLIRNEGDLVVSLDETGKLEHKGPRQFTGTGDPIAYVIDNYSAGTVEINGGTLSSTKSRSLRNFYTDGNVVINDGVFIGQIWMQQGNASGSGDHTDKIGSLIIRGGNFSPAGADGSSIFLTNHSADNVKLEVTGGTFETKIGCNDANKDGVEGKVSGGKFTESAMTNTASALIAAGYQFNLNKGDKYYYLEKITVW